MQKGVCGGRYADSNITINNTVNIIHSSIHIGSPIFDDPPRKKSRLDRINEISDTIYKIAGVILLLLAIPDTDGSIRKEIVVKLLQDYVVLPIQDVDPPSDNETHQANEDR